MKTNFDTLRGLARYSINALTDKNLIAYAIEKRQDLIEALATEYGVSFSTDEDIKDQAIEEVEEKLGQENINEDVTETEMYNHAKKEIIKGFQGESIAGLYMVESLNQIANRVKEFLLDCDLVDDVYATDEELVDFLVQKIRHFGPHKA